MEPHGPLFHYVLYQLYVAQMTIKPINMTFYVQCEV